MLIRGNELTAEQRRQVLAAFVHRHMSGVSDEDWLTAHAFHFTKAGRLMARRHAEPECLTWQGR